MNKGQLIDSISEKTKLSKTDVSDVLNAMNDIILETLKAGDLVKVPGFGTFTAKNKDAKKGRNPKTGETIDIPAKTVAKMKMSNDFVKKLNN